MMPYLTRYINNPVMHAGLVPYPASLTFNAGVVKYEGRYIMLFRNDYGSSAEDWAAYRRGERDVPTFRTNLGFATSQNGLDWVVEPTPRWSIEPGEVTRLYDPRITIVDGQPIVCFAMDTRHGVRGGIATTDDFENFDVRYLSVPDNRNMVLFPEKVNGDYFRLERPFTVYSRGQDRFDIWCGTSPDLVNWGRHELVLGVEDVPFANDKIGPAAPPVKTPKGWLTTFHSVWRDNNLDLGGWEKRWNKRYDAGLMLLDLNDPSKVIGICDEPLLKPTASYEKEGYRNEVIFPCGLVLEDNDEVKVYYGAADACVAVASASLGDLLALCKPYRRGDRGVPA